jgi:hypothetical protein
MPEPLVNFIQSLLQPFFFGISVEYCCRSKRDPIVEFCRTRYIIHSAEQKIKRHVCDMRTLRGVGCFVEYFSV